MTRCWTAGAPRNLVQGILTKFDPWVWQCGSFWFGAAADATVTGLEKWQAIHLDDMVNATCGRREKLAMTSEQESGNDIQAGEISGKETLVLVLIVLGTAPWAYVWITHVAPALGLKGISWKLDLLFILGLPAMLMWIMSFLFFPRDEQ